MEPANLYCNRSLTELPSWLRYRLSNLVSHPLPVKRPCVHKYAILAERVGTSLHNEPVLRVGWSYNSRNMRGTPLGDLRKTVCDGLRLPAENEGKQPAGKPLFGATGCRFLSFLENTLALPVQQGGRGFLLILCFVLTLTAATE